MSSMRNAVQRRNHKERAQPLERQKWGLLEKHKDYSLRAKDHNEKKKRLKALRQKAADRNPDEFAFGMMSATTRNGVKTTQRGRENGTTGSLSTDVVKLLKTQDQGYLQTVLQQTRRERERLEQQVIIADAGVEVGANNGRVRKLDVMESDGVGAEPVRVASDGEPTDGDYDFDLDMEIGSEEDDDQSEEEEEEGLTTEQLRRRRKKKNARKVLHAHLEALRDREKQLSTALNELDQQRARISNNVGGVNKNGVKFKVRERKR